jgi:hypothetical protein
VLFEAQLGVLVKVPANLDHPGQDLARRRQDLGRVGRIHRAKIARRRQVELRVKSYEL